MIILNKLNKICSIQKMQQKKNLKFIIKLRSVYFVKINLQKPSIIAINFLKQVIKLINIISNFIKKLDFYKFRYC